MTKVAKYAALAALAAAVAMACIAEFYAARAGHAPTVVLSRAPQPPAPLVTNARLPANAVTDLMEAG